MNTGEKNPFRIEELRDNLARKRRYKQLRETYNVNLPEIKDFNTSSFWDSLNNRKILTKEDNPMGYDRVRSVASLIKGHGLKILNVGFGTGGLERIIFKSNSVDWLGVDISKWAVENAKKKYPKAIFLKADIRKLKLKTQNFDCVIFMEVLEHIRPSQPFDVLAKIRKTLNPRGKFVVSVPLDEGLELMIKDGINPNAHLRVYTPELLEVELKIAEFRVIWKKELFAFSNFYFLKTIIIKYLVPGLQKSGNIIFMSEKQ